MNPFRQPTEAEEDLDFKIRADKVAFEERTSSRPSGYYWAKNVNYPIWQVYYIQEDKAFPCAPNRLVAYILVSNLRDIKRIEAPTE